MESNPGFVLFLNNSRPVCFSHNGRNHILTVICYLLEINSSQRKTTSKQLIYFRVHAIDQHLNVFNKPTRVNQEWNLKCKITFHSQRAFAFNQWVFAPGKRSFLTAMPVFPFPPLHLAYPANTASVQDTEREQESERGRGREPGSAPQWHQRPTEARGKRNYTLVLRAGRAPVSMHSLQMRACVCVWKHQ